MYRYALADPLGPHAAIATCLLKTNYFDKSNTDSTFRKPSVPILRLAYELITWLCAALIYSGQFSLHSHDSDIKIG